LLKIEPIAGVVVLQADFRDAILLRALGDAKADVVLSDVAPNLSGIAHLDQARSLELVQAAIAFCRQAMKPGGVFLVKAFHGEAFKELMSALKDTFAAVKVVKPPASRGESSETYFVARGLTAP